MASTIYKQATSRNLSSRTGNRFFLHLRAKTQEGDSLRTTSAAPLDRVTRVQFLLAEPHNQAEPYAQAVTVEHIQQACTSFTPTLASVEVSDPLKRNLPQLFKITCTGTLTSIVPRLVAGYIAVQTPGKTYFFNIEQ